MVVFAFIAAGCGHSTSNGNSGTGNIKFDSTITEDQRDALIESLNYLDSQNDWEPNTALSNLTGNSNISSPALRQWLEDRVQYILASSFDYKRSAFVSNQHFSYENPGVFPDEGASTFLSLSATGGSTPQMLMNNLGASLYLAGKHMGSLIFVNIPGFGEVQLTSPRVGVIQLGDGLFPKERFKSSAPGYIALISILFHEGHHSDGNGKSLGFNHAVCPAGHAYAGYYACDRNLNGPYTLQAVLEKALIKKCMQCNAGQKELLNQMVTDDFSRVLPTTENWDSSPEGHR